MAWRAPRLLPSLSLLPGPSAAGTEQKITPNQRRADALSLWLDEHVQPRVQLVVHAFEGGGLETPATQDAQGSLAEEAPLALVTEEGSRVSAETSSRLACDAEVVPIARGKDGSVLDVGRRRRTALGNLVLLCPFHHRAVHEGGRRVEVDDRGVLRFLNPLGVPMPVAPEPPDIGKLLPRGGLAGPAVDGEAVPPPDYGLARWHGRADISPWAGTTLWHGERIDWAWALDWFCNEQQRC